MTLYEIYELETLLSVQHEMEKRGEEMRPAERERLEGLLRKEQAWHSADTR